MNTRNCILVGLLLVFGGLLSYSQTTQGKALEIKPYVGISVPTGDIKEFAENGSVLGLSIDKYFSSKFALGLDINLQLSSFNNPFDFSSISNPHSISESHRGTWNATALAFGPTYKIGANKFSAEVYSKAGILYVKSPGYKAILNSTDFSKSIFDLPSQERIHKLEKDFPNFKFYLALSEPMPEDNWKVKENIDAPGDGFVGFIHSCVIDNYLIHHESPEDIELYFCGPPLMNQAVQKMGEDFGIPDEHIRFDDFGG